MRPYDEIAVAPPSATVLDVMTAITNAGVGAACIVDEDRHLLGLISDGDFRRHMVSSPHRLDASADEIMNRSASTISPDLLAVEALESFQNLPRKIGDMPVVEDGKVIGLLLLKDLLRIGIV